MHLSPLILEYYFIKKVQFELKEGFDMITDRKLEGVELPELKINVETAKKEREWRVELNIDSDAKSKKSQFPYFFNVVLVGYFQVDENYPAQQADLLAQINAPSMLYSAGRELLLNISGRSPYPPIVLPSFSFAQDVKPTKSAKPTVKKSVAKKPVKKPKIQNNK